MKSLLQRLGKLLADAKKSKHLQNMQATKKQFVNNWEVEKRKPNVELVEPDPFLEKNKSKNFRSRKKNFEKKNKKRINRSSHFRYGAPTKIFVETYNKVPVLETFISSHTRRISQYFSR